MDWSSKQELQPCNLAVSQNCSRKHAYAKHATSGCRCTELYVQPLTNVAPMPDTGRDRCHSATFVRTDCSSNSRNLICCHRNSTYARGCWLRIMLHRCSLYKQVTFVLYCCCCCQLLWWLACQVRQLLPQAPSAGHNSSA